MLDKYIEEFNKSYTQCIYRIEPIATFPYNESQLFGTYFDEIQSFKQQYINKIEIIPLNPSILRSMLVMDLYGEDPQTKRKIFKYYIELLTQYYHEDLFSLNRNIPYIYNPLDYKDYLYFSIDAIEISYILNLCFQYSYASRFDIFADNVYETIGPFHSKNTTYVIYRFLNIIDLPIEVIYFSNITSGKIDMFGHSDINFKKQTGVILINGELYTNFSELLEILQKKLSEIDIQPTMREFIGSYNERYINAPINSFSPESKNICDKIIERAELIKKIIL